MITKLIALTFVFFSSVISASEYGASVALTKITYGNDNHVSWLSVDVDEQNNIDGFSFHKFLENELVASQEYGSYINYAGVTLEYKKEHEYLVLRGLNVSVYNGGAVELEFLLSQFHQIQLCSLEQDESTLLFFHFESVAIHLMFYQVP